MPSKPKPKTPTGNLFVNSVDLRERYENGDLVGTIGKVPIRLDTSLDDGGCKFVNPDGLPIPIPVNEAQIKKAVSQK